MASLKVNDAQTAKSEGYWAFRHFSTIVRSAMFQTRRHERGKGSLFGEWLAVEIKDASYSTHFNSYLTASNFLGAELKLSPRELRTC
jgi:hypothetical protein